MPLTAKSSNIDVLLQRNLGIFPFQASASVRMWTDWSIPMSGGSVSERVGSVNQERPRRKSIRNGHHDDPCHIPCVLAAVFRSRVIADVVFSVPPLLLTKVTEISYCFLTVLPALAIFDYVSVARSD